MPEKEFKILIIFQVKNAILKVQITQRVDIDGINKMRLLLRGFKFKHFNDRHPSSANDNANRNAKHS